MTKRRKVIVHIATSADGYIARTDGDLEWLTSRPVPEGLYGMNAFMRSIDTTILGRKTYEVSLRRGVREQCNRPIRDPSSRAPWQGYLVDGRRRAHRLLSRRAGDR